MAFSERIKLVIDVVSDKGASSLKSFRSELSETEGASAKMGVAFGKTGDFIKANAAGFAAAAGTAIVGFVAKGVSQFNDLALSAGKMADATGASAEEMSRWAAVADDVGVSGDAVTSAMLKMEKAAGSTPKLFDQFGVSLVKTRDGALDANATFLNTIERLRAIEDPSARAVAGNKLLGKSWSELAEIINQTDLKDKLAGVSEAQVIDAEEVAKAREFRDALDTLGDKAGDLAISVGELAVPALTGLLDIVNAITDALPGASDEAGKLVTAQGKLIEAPSGNGFSDFLSGNVDAIKIAVENVLGLKEATDSYVSTSDGAGTAAEAYADSLNEAHDAAQKLAQSKVAEKTAEMARRSWAAAEAVKDLTREYEILMGSLDDDEAFLSVQDSFDELKTKAEEAFYTAGAGAADAEQKQRDYEHALIATKKQVAEYATSVLGIPVSKVTAIVANLDPTNVDDIERQLASLARNRSISANIIAKGGAGYEPGFGGKRAAGGPTKAGSFYEVNEGDKSELLTENGKTYLMAGANGQVTPLSSAGASPALGGGVTINVTGFVGSEYELGQKLTEVLERWQRGGGS